jgi:hypothetical protein
LKFEAFDLDLGLCNIYKILLQSELHIDRGLEPLFISNDKIIATLLAPSLEDLGYNLTLMTNYSIKGSISNNETFGRIWEFNPLLVKACDKIGLEHRPHGMDICGVGIVQSIQEVWDSTRTKHIKDKILVNHQPSVS